MGDIVGSFSNEALWGIIIVMGIAILLLLGELFYARLQLHSRQERYWWVLGASDMYMFEYDAVNDELLLSEHFSVMLGIPRHIFQFSKVMGNTRNPQLRKGLDNIPRILEAAENEQNLELVRQDGSTGIFRVRCNSFNDKHGNLCSTVGILMDVTREVHEEEVLRARAELDGLTAVYNSGTVWFLIERMLKERPERAVSGFVMLDVDHFKEINDTMGHMTGDRVLQKLTESLRSSIRETDVIGRLGGDEFCIYLPKIAGYDFLCDFCERLNSVAVKNFEEADLGMGVTISIGGVMVRNQEDFADVYGRADKVLYAAKAQGRNTSCVAE